MHASMSVAPRPVTRRKKESASLSRSERSLFLERQALIISLSLVVYVVYTTQYYPLAIISWRKIDKNILSRPQQARLFTAIRHASLIPTLNCSRKNRRRCMSICVYKNPFSSVVFLHLKLPCCRSAPWIHSEVSSHIQPSLRISRKKDIGG